MKRKGMRSYGSLLSFQLIMDDVHYSIRLFHVCQFLLLPISHPRKDKYNRKLRKYYVEYEEGDESAEEDIEREIREETHDVSGKEALSPIRLFDLSRKSVLFSRSITAREFESLGYTAPLLSLPKS